MSDSNKTTEREAIVSQIAELRKRLEVIDGEFKDVVLPKTVSSLQSFLNKLDHSPSTDELLEFVKENPRVEIRISGFYLSPELGSDFGDTVEIQVTVWEALTRGYQGLFGRGQTFSEAAAAAGARACQRLLQRTENKS